MIRKTLAKVIILVVLIEDQIFDTCIFTLFGEFEKKIHTQYLFMKNLCQNFNLEAYTTIFFTFETHDVRLVAYN